MATTTTAFEAEILAISPLSGLDRGLMASCAYRLRQGYLAGAIDPNNHTNAKNHQKKIDALNRNSKLASFDAITGP